MYRISDWSHQWAVRQRTFILPTSACSLFRCLLRGFCPPWSEGHLDGINLRNSNNGVHRIGAKSDPTSPIHCYYNPRFMLSFYRSLLARRSLYTIFSGSERGRLNRRRQEVTHLLLIANLCGSALSSSMGYIYSRRHPGEQSLEE